MGKIQDLRTTHQTTRRYKLLAIRNIETHDGYGYVLQSFMMVGACSSEQWKDNFDNMTLHIL
jgi:hypothetical protein